MHREKVIWRHTGKRRPCNYSDASQKNPDYREPLGAERGKERFLPRAVRKSMGLMTSWFYASSFENCEKVIFCCSTSSNLWFFFFYGNRRKQIQIMNMEQVVKKLWVGEVGRHANFSSMTELAWEQESYQGKKELVFLGIKDDQKTLWLVQKTQEPTWGEDRGSQGHCHEDSCSPCSEICTVHIALVDSRKLAAVGIYQTSIWLQTFSAATSLISNIF